VLLEIYCTTHQVLPMDIQSHETRGERMREFGGRHLLILLAPH
jgi:hypothetical protein